jgi:hypothetical protein
MKSPFLSPSTGGILALFLGFLFIGLSSHHSQQNDEFLERGLLREGRVVSHDDADGGTPSLLRIMTNVSPKVSGADMQIIEVKVKKGDIQKAPVGSLLNLVLIPGDPPRARLAGSAKRVNYRFGYVIASLCICLGLLLLWLGWRRKNPPTSQLTEQVRKTKSGELAPTFMEEQAIKNRSLYDGPIEFSYSSEKTQIELKNGTRVRVSQYRPLSDLPEVLADKDLLHVLRTAQSDWKLVDTIKTGQLALSHLLREKHATEADQFFISGAYLGLLFRDEIDNGHWYSMVRGVWKISTLSRTLAKLTSGDPALAQEAALEILNHPDHTAIANLAPGLPSIRGAFKKTPRTGEFSDDRRFITRAADVIQSLSQGLCYCHVYAKSSDPPQLPIKNGKFILKDSNDEKKKSEVTCTHCQKEYSIKELPGSYLPYYVWELKK